MPRTRTCMMVRSYHTALLPSTSLPASPSSIPATIARTSSATTFSLASLNSDPAEHSKLWNVRGQSFPRTPFLPTAETLGGKFHSPRWP